MEYKVDYLTLTIKPYDDSNFDCSRFENFLFQFFGLTKIRKSFLCMSGGKYYEKRYRYENISIQIPYAFTAGVQGYCITFTGDGLAFYSNYIRKYEKNWTIKDLLTGFFSLGNLGYDCRCTRIDLAFDDISREEKKRYTLNMKTIENALVKGEFVSMLRSKNIDDGFAARTCKKSNRNEQLGNTIYIGNRKSKTFVRFYDKLLEQKSKREVVDETIKHWVRMEFEFKDSRAMSICESIIALEADAFSRYISRVVNKYICFVVIKEGCRANYNRCPQKRWWTRFVGTVEKSKLSCNYIRRNRFHSSKTWLEKCAFPSIYALLQCITIDELLFDIKRFGIEHFNDSHQEIIDDFINETESESTPKGYEVHKLTCDCYEELLAEFEKARTKNSFMRANREEAKACFDSIDNLSPSEMTRNYRINTATYNQSLFEFESCAMQEYEDLKFLGFYA